MATQCAFAQEPTTPAAGSKERKALMDALRVPVSKALPKREIVFKVNVLSVLGDWAFMSGVPQLPGGKKMDYKGTVYAQMIKDEIFDDWICALLKREKGKWKVVDWQIGATDVGWDGWHTKHKAPKAIFPYPKC